MVSKFDWSKIISYFFLWTAEHDVLTKHKIKRNTEVVVLSPILSLKAEQQRKVINLFLLFSPSSPPIFSYTIPHMCVMRRQQYNIGYKEIDINVSDVGGFEIWLLGYTNQSWGLHHKPLYI